MSTKQAIEQVLKGRRKPMRVPEIIAAGVPLATSLKGQTPGQTFYSVLYSESKRADGLVVQTGRGEFKLNPEATPREGLGVNKYSITLDGVTVKASDVGEALEVAADLLEAAGAIAPDTTGATAGVVITVDGELDEALTELAREGLRPVRR
jgi:hypothetical protein